MTAAAYHVAGVTFCHPRSPRPVLDNLHFSVRQGEFLGIIGPNGSGKTSLLNLLGRLVRPQAGTIRLFGEDLGVLKPSAIARMIGVVPQDGRPTFAFSVLETVLMGRFPHHEAHGLFATVAGRGWECETDREIAWQGMRDTGVAHLADRSIDTLSGGEWQRVLIARALTQEPRVMLLDEPTAHLDLQHQADICALLRTLNESRGLTVVLVSHDLNLASQYCDRLLLLHERRIAACGSVQEVLSRDVLRTTYGCDVLIDPHPLSGVPRITMPGRPTIRQGELR